MRQLSKLIARHTLKPLITKYISKPRTYKYKSIKLVVPNGVFHPALFFTTKTLLNYIQQLNLENKTLLELGAGSGLISFYAAKNGAIVTATDINSKAINYLEKNSIQNAIDIRIIRSDLFTEIPSKQFDIIIINPPFYAKQPATEAEYAWYCGPNGEYFINLFKSIRNYLHSSSLVVMVLSDDGDVNMVKRIAEQHNYSMTLLKTRKILWETNFIYKIAPAAL